MSQTADTGTDPLTGLPGYEDFTRAFAQAMQRTDDASSNVALALFDIDWFAKKNKEHGTAAGDALLQLLSEHVVKSFEGHGAAYRYGGDALMVLLPGVSKEQAFLMAEEARRSFSRMHEVKADGRKRGIELTVSVGIAAYPDDGSKDADVLRKANEAVYRAKVSGRNKSCLAREEKMVTKTSHFTQGQLEGLSRLAKREGLNEAVLLREAVDDLLRKYNR